MHGLLREKNIYIVQTHNLHVRSNDWERVIENWFLCSNENIQRCVYFFFTLRLFVVRIRHWGIRGLSNKHTPADYMLPFLELNSTLEAQRKQDFAKHFEIYFFQFDFFFCLVSLSLVWKMNKTKQTIEDRERKREKSNQHHRNLGNVCILCGHHRLHYVHTMI